MAISIAWSGTEPTVDKWTKKTTGEYKPSNYESVGWKIKIEFSLGHITGTNNVCIRAQALLGVASGYTANSVTVTPKVKATGGSYVSGSQKTKTQHNSNPKFTWYDFGNAQYATVSGISSDITLTCAFTKSSTTKSVTFDVARMAPEIYVKAGRAWIQAETVYEKAGEAWTDVQGIYTKVNNVWQEA